MRDEATTSEEDRVWAVLERCLDGLRARDAGAVAACYAADASVADLAPPLMHRGLDRAGLQDWLDTWDGPLEIETRDVTLKVDGGLAAVWGLQRTAGLRGGVPMAWWSRVTLALTRRPEGWRIAHLHESTPFLMDGSLRAAVDLVPED